MPKAPFYNAGIVPEIDALLNPNQEVSQDGVVVSRR
jgi:hypothetical protein